jgi:hypothetical protein
VQFSDFIALTALIVSLFSIWLQDRGARQQLLVANISEYTKRYQEIFEKFPKSILDEDFNLDSFSDDEQEKLLRYIWLYFDLCYEEYVLYYDLKLVNKQVWKLWEAGMVSAFSRSSFRQCWVVISYNSFYPEKFSKFVSNIMSIKANKTLQRM